DTRSRDRLRGQRRAVAGGRRTASYSAAVAPACRRRAAAQPRHGDAKLFQSGGTYTSRGALRRQADPVRTRSRGYRRLARHTSMNPRAASDMARLRVRRRLLQSAGALAVITCVPARAADSGLPALPALTAFLAGRTPRRERISLDLPRIADNGLSVPMRVSVSGPFAPGPFVRKL